MKLNKKGFTLIELLAVIVVLSIILAIAIPKITNTIKTSKDGAFKNSVKIIMNVARDYAIRNQLPSSAIKIYKIEEPPPEYPEGKEWLEFKGKEKYKGTWKWEDNKVTILSLITESNSIFGVDNNNNIDMANVDPLYELKSGTFYNVTISGTTIGSKSYTTLVGYTGPSKKIKIPQGIKTIGQYSLCKSELRNVIIPDSVTSIGNNAFYTNQLTSLTIPNSVISIGSNAFAHNLLTSLTIPNSVTSIGESAFAYNQITNVTIPNSVISLAGFGRNKLTSVTIPDSVTSIGAGSFDTNQLTSVTIPNSVISISANAFSNNQLNSVKLSNSVTSIAMGAFRFNNLSSITIPNSVTSIQSSAFAYNPLITIKNETGNNFNWKSILNVSDCTMITGESNDNFITGSCNYSYHVNINGGVSAGSGTVNITN